MLKKKYSYYLENNYNKDDIKIEYNFLDNISYKNKINSKIGSIKIYYKDTLLEEDNIYLDRKINFNLISFIKQNNYVKYSLITIFVGILIYLLKLYLNNRKNIININE